MRNVARTIVPFLCLSLDSTIAKITTYTFNNFLQRHIKPKHESIGTRNITTSVVWYCINHAIIQTNHLCFV